MSTTIVQFRKLVGERVWRFASHDRPWHLECFVDGSRVDHPLPATTADAARALAAHFGLPADIVWTALAVAVDREGREGG